MHFYVDFEFETDDGIKAFVEGECTFSNELNFRSIHEYQVEDVQWTITDENNNKVEVNEIDAEKIEKKVIRLAEREL